MRPEDVERMLTPLDSPEKTPRPRRRRRNSLITIAVLFTAYVLSIGPLYWKWYGAKSGLGSPIYLLIYRPLEALAQFVPSFGKLLNWYISLWLYD